MATLFLILLVGIAGITVGVVLYLVMTEKHVHEEHYIPQPKGSAQETASEKAKE
jgi:hypothetical protein